MVIRLATVQHATTSRDGDGAATGSISTPPARDARQPIGRGPRDPGVVGGASTHTTSSEDEVAGLVEPAVRLARDGVVLDTFHATEMAAVTRTMADYAGTLPADRTALRAGMTATLGTFRKADGTTYAAGETWRQPDLATTLAAIAAGGADAFYRGPLARTLAARVTAMGGMWTEADLANYQAVEREPIRFTYHGHDIITMPPPSGGGITMRQSRRVRRALERLDWDSVALITFTRALLAHYADSTHCSDPVSEDSNYDDPRYRLSPKRRATSTGRRRRRRRRQGRRGRARASGRSTVGRHRAGCRASTSR